MSGPQGGGDGGGRGSKRAGAAPDPPAAAARGQRAGGGRSTALRALAWRQMRQRSARRPRPARLQHTPAALLLPPRCPRAGRRGRRSLRLSRRHSRGCIIFDPRDV